jgi:hypothetical protein
VLFIVFKGSHELPPVGFLDKKVSKKSRTQRMLSRRSVHPTARASVTCFNLLLYVSWVLRLPAKR